MHGNLRELCHDWFGPYPNNLAIDPSGVDKGSYKVHRGSSWRFDATGLRSAERNGPPNNVPSYGSNYFGFRLCLAPARSPR